MNDLAESSLARQYLVAKRAVVEAGYANEIAWQAEASLTQVTAELFVREATWVVMSAGLSESVVRRRFPLIAELLFDFDLERIDENPSCRQAALSAFRHKSKIDAILTIAAWALEVGDEGIRRVIESRDERRLMELPFIGRITVRHLLKNLGAPVAKPDRHLSRLASLHGWPVDQLCAAIAAEVSEPVSVVDIVLWRWSTLHARMCRGVCDGLPHPID